MVNEQNQDVNFLKVGGIGRERPRVRRMMINVTIYNIYIYMYIRALLWCTRLFCLPTSGIPTKKLTCPFYDVFTSLLVVPENEFYRHLPFHVVSFIPTSCTIEAVERVEKIGREASAGFTALK